MNAAREEIAGLPSDAAHAVVRQQSHDALAEILDLWTSLGISARESSFRGDMWLTAYHLRQARDVLREAFAAFRKLEPSLGAAILDRNGKNDTGGPNPNPNTRASPHER
jgi:hypothetical protein